MNEIKIGQWIRGFDRNELLARTRVGKIAEITKSRLVVDFGGYTGYLHIKDNYKTADNLVDLLEIGDIIHCETDLANFKEKTLKTQEDVDRIKSTKNYDVVLKITDIELHENRVRQVIGSE